MPASLFLRAGTARCCARLCVPLLVLALSGCSRPPPTEEPVRSVKITTIAVSPFDSAPEFSAEVRARVESRIGFRVAGKITQRQAELGQHVKAGQVLAQLDPRDYQLAAEAARAQFALARTNRDLASADLKRSQNLRAQNFISSADIERRETTFKAAQAQYEQAVAQLSSQGNQASYTTLVADVPGIVTAIEAEPGQVVAAGTAVVRIARDGPRDVVFSVPEDRVASIKTGSAVSVRGWSDDREMAGTVREVAGSADPVTRTFTVKVALEATNPPALGATVYARPKALGRSGAAVIKLPTSALRQDGLNTAVWVLDPASMTVRSQPVRLATADGNEAVVASGLTPGMQVVVAGVHVLSPNQKVSIFEPKVPEASDAPAQGAIKTVAPPTPDAAR